MGFNRTVNILWIFIKHKCSRYVFIIIFMYCKSCFKFVKSTEYHFKKVFSTQSVWKVPKINCLRKLTCELYHGVLDHRYHPPAFFPSLNRASWKKWLHMLTAFHALTSNDSQQKAKRCLLLIYLLNLNVSKIKDFQMDRHNEHVRSFITTHEFLFTLKGWDHLCSSDKREPEHSSTVTTPYVCWRKVSFYF